MERIFLNTNPLLDFVPDKSPFTPPAEKVIALRYTHNKRIHTSALSLAKVACVVRKAAKNANLVIDELVTCMQLVSLTKTNIVATRHLKGLAAATIHVVSTSQQLKSLKR